MDAQVLLGFEGKAYHMRDFYCSQILANILGGGMSSRLFQEVREIRGLCYSVYAFHWGFSDTGIFGILAIISGAIFAWIGGRADSALGPKPVTPANATSGADYPAISQERLDRLASLLGGR